MKEALVHFVRGVGMGAADVIPGVSGGTVALLVGIYERLVEAITHFDARLVRLVVRERDWRGAAKHADLALLVPLGLGIATGIASLASLLHHLLEHHPVPTYAAFFGLILASSYLVARLVERWSIAAVVAAVIGVGLAYVLTGPQVGASILGVPAESLDHPAYIFLCGAIAICAMILPGISGSYLLVLLGTYKLILGGLKGLLKGQGTSDDVIRFVVFGAGCVVGILSFSRLLRFILARYHAITLALLGGFMLGSLRRLWPFKTYGVSEYDWTNRWASGVDEAAVPVAILVGAAIAVLLADALARRRSATTQHGSHQHGSNQPATHD